MKEIRITIPENIFERLSERCKKLGCTVEEFVFRSVELTLNQRTEFDFGLDD
ncbi:MAG: hypothetical protein GWN01_16765 [Nitrosopumilaceae archaeon]|nr:hypothetical protein [Nitrosopumilaceae archaeon]NIU02486.1 hypothetical protein [Nitrosopumilaceae archaeon]NIU88947.1 hypothetical protein [Nitrosopumilaceae archaeon]NIV67058.1 hypothetical protein [Nitrosopumilaceae archaeon]NIX63087.1 hypothetical protein [Nitrosopumilaceae archaeon]